MVHGLGIRDSGLRVRSRGSGTSEKGLDARLDFDLRCGDCLQPILDGREQPPQLDLRSFEDILAGGQLDGISTPGSFESTTNRNRIALHMTARLDQGVPEVEE